MAQMAFQNLLPNLFPSLGFEDPLFVLQQLPGYEASLNLLPLGGAFCAEVEGDSKLLLQPSSLCCFIRLHNLLGSLRSLCKPLRKFILLEGNGGFLSHAAHPGGSFVLEEARSLALAWLPFG